MTTNSNEPSAPQGTPPTTPTETTPKPADPASLAAAPAPSEPPKEGAPAAEPPKEGDGKPAEGFDLSKLEMPEGLTIPDDQAKALTEIVGKHGIPAEAVQDLLPLVRDALKAESESSARTWVETNESWQQEIKSDPVFGGQKLDANLQLLGKTIEQYAPDPAAFREALNFTGAGNNPAIFRTFVRMAQALAEGTPVAAGGGSKPRPTSAAQALFPNLPSANGA